MTMQNKINTKVRLIQDLPQTLVLQKKYIQQFGNGQKVALYFCRNLKKYFSICYNQNGIELFETDYSIINTLRNINAVQTITFNDGSYLKIDKDCSSEIINLYEELEEGKDDFKNYIMESDRNFLNILKYSINKKHK